MYDDLAVYVSVKPGWILAYVPGVNALTLISSYRKALLVHRLGLNARRGWLWFLRCRSWLSRWRRGTTWAQELANLKGACPDIHIIVAAARPDHDQLASAAFTFVRHTFILTGKQRCPISAHTWALK
eukprot:jgi/Ulvmu1/7070/UM033_0131.1